MYETVSNMIDDPLLLPLEDRENIYQEFWNRSAAFILPALETEQGQLIIAVMRSLAVLDETVSTLHLT